MSDPGLPTTEARTEQLVDLIAAALCRQEELAEVNGGEKWWGMGTDDVARLCAAALLPRVAGLVAERQELQAQLERIKKAADISFRGPSHSNAWHLRQAASRLDRGYQAGGSNSCAAIARILREVAAVLSDDGSEKK